MKNNYSDVTTFINAKPKFKKEINVLEHIRMEKQYVKIYRCFY